MTPDELQDTCEVEEEVVEEEVEAIPPPGGAASALPHPASPGFDKHATPQVRSPTLTEGNWQATHERIVRKYVFEGLSKEKIAEAEGWEPVQIERILKSKPGRAAVRRLKGVKHSTMPVQKPLPEPPLMPEEEILDIVMTGVLPWMRSVMENPDASDTSKLLVSRELLKCSGLQKSRVEKTSKSMQLHARTLNAEELAGLVKEGERLRALTTTSVEIASNDANDCV